MGFSILTIE